MEMKRPRAPLPTRRTGTEIHADSRTARRRTRGDDARAHLREELDHYAPLRLCCGQRHFGPVCPDGLVMCCLCFERVPVEHLSPVDLEDSGVMDVCAECLLEAPHQARH